MDPTDGPRSRTPEAEQPLRLRELGKKERLESISQAARELFLEEGFERSTIRRIARRAKVAVGTVFRYAASKEELLVLVFSGPLERVIDEALESRDDGATPIEQLVDLFGRVLEHLSAHAGLSRILVKELTFLEPDRAGPRVRQARFFVEKMAGWVEHWQEQRLLRSDADPELVARCVFALNFDQVVPLLSGEFDVEEAKRRLRSALELLFEGLRPLPPTAN